MSIWIEDAAMEYILITFLVTVTKYLLEVFWFMVQEGIQYIMAERQGRRSVRYHVITWEPQLGRKGGGKEGEGKGGRRREGKEKVRRRGEGERGEREGEKRGEGEKGRGRGEKREMTEEV